MFEEHQVIFLKQRTIVSLYYRPIHLLLPRPAGGATHPDEWEEAASSHWQPNTWYHYRLCLYYAHDINHIYLFIFAIFITFLFFLTYFHISKGSEWNFTTLNSFLRKTRNGTNNNLWRNKVDGAQNLWRLASHQAAGACLRFREQSPGTNSRAAWLVRNLARSRRAAEQGIKLAP